MAQVVFVAKARKNNPAVKKGKPYYWWKFRYGEKRYSAKCPRDSQLTQSEFWTSIHSLREEMEDAEPKTRDELRGLIEEWMTRLEEVGELQGERRDNMLDEFQDGPIAEMLQARVDGLEEWGIELDNIELSDEEDEEDVISAALERAVESAFSGE